MSLRNVGQRATLPDGRLDNAVRHSGKDIIRAPPIFTGVCGVSGE
jgi:hypothetical protein